MADQVSFSERWLRPRISLVVLLVAILGAAAWAAFTASIMRDREVRAMRALVDLHGMRHATRALLSARSSFPHLAVDWQAAVEAFSTSFEALARGGPAGRLEGLAGSWQAIKAEVPPVRAAITALAAGPLAEQVGDEGVEQTIARLLTDRHATAGLLDLRRLQSHLGVFDSGIVDFAKQLEAEATGIASEAAAATRLASTAAMVLLVTVLLAGAWLLLRISLLNLHLGGAMASLERARAEAAHREQVLRAVLDGLGEGVVLVDADGLLVWANPAARQLIGAETVLQPGVAWQGLLDLRDSDGQALRTTPGCQAQRWLDARLTHVRGEVRIDLAVAPVLTAGDRPGLVVVLVDLTARRVLEEQLRRAQSLEALGRLAGGVAHDFNNLLAGILGNAELLGLRLADQPVLRQRVDTIITAGSRAAALTRQLLDSSRRSAMQRGRVDLHQLVQESVGLLRRSIDRRIEITTTLAAPVPWVDGDAALLQGALVNLAINARDAMPDGGRLDIATVAAAAPADASGSWLALRVTDNGSGMAPEVLPRIFDAFFTTKAVGKGSGLGLAAVQGTVLRHGGRITVDSAPGRGTTFTILLPQCAAPAGVAVHPPERSGPAATQVRLLLVEDEEVVRNIAVDVLSDLGYQVTTAVDGVDGVERLAAAPEAFDIAILDLVMPRMGGVEALVALRAISPRLPVLLWSGYSAGHDIDALLGDGRTAFIAKPAAHAALGRALAGLLAVHG